MKNWIIKTNKETIIEGQKPWNEVKNDIKQLIFNNNGQKITLPENMDKYICAKTASADLGQNNVKIESRYIGCELGNIIIKVRIDEKTNDISIEIEK